MPYPQKKDRNAKLVKIRDEMGLSFNAIGRAFGIKSNTAAEVYWRQKKREVEPQKQLSTAS